MKLKRIISLLLAMLLVTAIAMPAFADDDTGTTTSDSETYDYKSDERLTVLTDFKSGEFAWGGYSPTMYQIVTDKLFTLNDVPVYEDEETGIEYTVEDSTSVDPLYEGVSIEALYAFKCPSCGLALTGDRLSAIYGGKNLGCCSHCGELLPDPSTVTIYRFIVIDEKSKHYDALYNYDFTDAAKDIYGPTESLYGEGKDLPQSYLVRGTDEEGNDIGIVDFYTSGDHVEFKDKLMTKLFMFLVKFQYKVTPVATNYANSTFTDVVWKLRLAILRFNEKILTALVTL